MYDFTIKKVLAVSIATIAALILALAAIATVVPHVTARKKSMLGYKAICPFTPISTAVLLVAAGFLYLLGSVG